MESFDLRYKQETIHPRSRSGPCWLPPLWLSLPLLPSVAAQPGAVLPSIPPPGPSEMGPSVAAGLSLSPASPSWPEDTPAPSSIPALSAALVLPFAALAQAALLAAWPQLP